MKTPLFVISLDFFTTTPTVARPASRARGEFMFILSRPRKNEPRKRIKGRAPLKPRVRAKTVGASASNVLARIERALALHFVECSVCPLQRILQSKILPLV